MPRALIYFFGGEYYLFKKDFLLSNVVIIPKVYLVPEVKPRDINIPRVLLLLVNGPPNLLVPKEKPRDTNSISYFYFYSATEPYYLLMLSDLKKYKDFEDLYIAMFGKKNHSLLLIRNLFYPGVYGTKSWSLV